MIDARKQKTVQVFIIGTLLLYPASNQRKHQFR
jgi:hypothetical protein